MQEGDKPRRLFIRQMMYINIYGSVSISTSLVAANRRA